MALEEYRKKRNLRRSGEPPGKKKAPRGNSFVVQKHYARSLHYDLRLEMEGTLKSWAVPRGPSLDPKEKRLAVHVEDHPLEYGSFEGTIPEGEYGAGTVILWDRGRWWPEGDLAETYRLGMMKFRLEGEKLRGRWTLVRMKGGAGGEGGKNWLLIKERDEEARPLAKGDILEERPESVAGLGEDELHSSRLLGLKGARPDLLRKRLVPQLATPSAEVPRGEDWFHEIKLDGYRLTCRVDQGDVKLYTRNGVDWTRRFPSIARAAATLPVREAFLDGEVVKLDRWGVSNFHALQEAFSSGAESSLVYFVFDLVHLDGFDLGRVPLSERKRLLMEILDPKGNQFIHYCDHIEGNGSHFYHQAEQMGLEGVVSKRPDRPYREGRSRLWLKTKCRKREEFVIGGFSEPRGSRAGLGALLVGYHDESGDLRYAGRVGTGLGEGLLKELRGRLEKLHREGSPFVDFPTGRSAPGVHWTEPRLLAEIKFTDRTKKGLLRHPSFEGLREDKSARRAGRVRTEEPRARTEKTARSAPGGKRKGTSREGVEIGGVAFTHPARLVYPDAGITKEQLGRFYESISGWILPHLEGRPLSLLRCPRGQHEPSFFQKNANKTIPGAVRRMEVEREGKKATYLMVDSPEGLLTLIQLGVLELHTWGARGRRIEFPDRVVFDLDPDKDLPWKRTVEAAFIFHELLLRLGLQSFVKTTGGKGLHVLVPLSGNQGWDEVRDFTRRVAEQLALAAPELFVTTSSLAKRKGKIYIDYQRNRRGATSVAAYSTRAHPGATVSVPLHWDELTPRIHSDAYGVRNLLRRLRKLKEDPWKGLHSLRQSITRAVKRDLGLK